MKRWLFMMACFGMTACSASPEKVDEPIAEGVVQDSSAVASVDSLVKDVEAVPDAETLGDVSEEETSTTVDSGTAGFINSAILGAEKGDLEGAASELESIVDQENGGYLAAYDLGVVRERQGKYDKAAKRYFQSLQKNADCSPALVNLIRLYLRQDRSADAERLAQKFMNARPDNFGHRVAALEVSLYKGQYEDVIRLSKAILRKDERHVDAMYALAQANFRLERFELARAVMERAVDLDGARADLYNMFGLVQLKLDNKPKAMINFQKAVELRSQYPEARNNLGVLYHDARDYVAAGEQFQEAIRIYPDFKQAFLNLGNAYKGLGRYKDAELAFKRAIGLDSKYGDAHFNLGILYLDSDIPGIDPIARLQKAIDSFKTYKAVAKDRRKDDPADKYIDEARKTIEVENQKKEMEREAQMGAETTE